MKDEIVGKNRMVYTGFGPSVRRGFVGLAILLAIFIAVKSLTPALPSLSITHGDKIIHTLAYLFLGIVTLPAMPRVNPFIIWLGLCGFGGSIEIAQGLMSTGRSADILDGIANASGAFLAVLTWWLLSRLVRKSM